MSVRDTKKRSSGQRAQPAQDLEPEDDPRGSAPVAAAVAKWLIPSVTVLFAAVGYIVQSAQQDLLGISVSSRDSTSLFLTSAEFMIATAAVPATFVDRLLDGRLTFAGHGVALVAGIAISALALAAHRLPRLDRHAGLAVGIALICMIAGKFVLLDDPLLQVRNVVASGSDRAPEQEFMLRFMTPAHAASSGPQSIARNIICSRVSHSAVRDDRLQVGKICGRASQADQDEMHRRELKGRFLTHAVASILIATLAIAALRRSRSVTSSVCAMLALLYLLTFPYAYGKLERSTRFDLASITLVGGVAGTPGEGERHDDALLVTRDAAGATMLVTRSLGCAVREAPAADGGDAQTAELDRTTVMLAFYPSSRIAAIDRIERYDVIEWVYNNEFVCPDSPIRAL